MSDEPLPIPHILYVDTAGSHLFVPATDQPPDPEPEPGEEAEVQVIIDGLRLTFSPADGVVLDDYVDPSGDFVQQCIVIEHPDLPGFRAYYRPDSDSTREEWVFEYGDPWISPPTASLPAYEVTITCHNGDIVDLEAPVGHYWFSRWRWCSAPRPVRATHSQLAELELIPWLDPTGLASGPIMTVSDYQPMSYCGIPSDQGQTGGYPGLGIITGWQAQYLTRNAPETAFRNQAEAAGSFQAHCRDTIAHCPIDLVNDYPNATKYSDKDGSPYIPKGPRVNKTDQGHMPSLSYVPFILTGDPYYLESLQFWANENMLSLPAKSRFMVAGRYLAWPLRELAQAYRATPDTVPNWLLPRDYWRHWVDICRGFVEARAANASDPFMWLFHTVQEAGQDSDKDPSPSGDHVWQQGMLQLVAAWIASWDSTWVEPAEWLVKGAVDRASATSGWCRTHPSPYHLRMQHASVLAEPLSATAMQLTLLYEDRFAPGETVMMGHHINPSETIVLGITHDGIHWTIERRGSPAKDHPVKRELFGAKHTSWCHSRECNVLVYAWTDTGDNDHLSPGTTDLTYPSYQRSALAQALHAGLEVPGLQDAYEWIDAEVRRLHVENNLPIGENWTVVPHVTTMRRHHRRSDRSDPGRNNDLRLLIEELRGED